MIQRIQSIYLLICSLFAGGLLSPFANYLTGNIQASGILSDGAFNAWDNPLLLIFIGVGALIFFIAIFLFKKRHLQIRIARLAGFLTIIPLVNAYYDSWQLMNNPSNNGILHWGIVPGILLAGVFVFQLLAITNIRKDDEIVSSMDRLR